MDGGETVNLELHSRKRGCQEGVVRHGRDRAGNSGANPLPRSDLSVAEREEYIDAVLCLQSKPSIAPEGEAPGSLSRFEDFVATHMTQAMMLHSPVRPSNDPACSIADSCILDSPVCQPQVFYLGV